MKRVVLGLGTNLGDRRENLRAALAALSHLPKTEVENVSSVWQTAPFDVPDEQQDYWNICVLLKTELSPSAVLGACLGIEAAMGRVREIYHGARCMDLDVLLYEGFTQREKELNVPHPGILERAFVLFPFAAGKRIPWSALQAARERFSFQFLLHIPSNSHQRLRPDGTAQ